MSDQDVLSEKQLAASRRAMVQLYESRDEQHHKLVQARMEIANLDARIGDLMAAEEQLVEQQREHGIMLQQVEEKVATLLREREVMLQEHALVSEERRLLLTSTSWRVTRPLRFAMRLLRYLLRQPPLIMRFMINKIRGNAKKNSLVSSKFSVVGSKLKSAPRIALTVSMNGLERLVHASARRATRRRTARGQVRTVWCLTPILTLPLLAKCDRLLGFQSDSLVVNSYHITNQFDISLERWEQRVARWSQRYGLLYPNFRKLVLFWLLRRYDVVHCFYDRGLLLSNDRFGIARDELSAYSATNKRLYTYAYGADVRAQEPTLALASPSICEFCPSPGKFCICNTDELASSIDRLEGHVTQKVSMGDMLAYVQGSRNMHYWPIDIDKFVAKPLPTRSNGPLRVAHAPNHPHFKGTSFLEEAVNALQKEGHDIEIVRVQGVPNEEVISLFRSCHIVADQFVSGFHGYTALEAMALGRPVLCFLRGPDMSIDHQSCPIINAKPDTIIDRLRNCLDGTIDLDAVGRSSRYYIERFYSLEATALRLGELYLDTASFPEQVCTKLRTRMDILQTELQTQLAQSNFAPNQPQA